MGQIANEMLLRFCFRIKEKLGEKRREKMLRLVRAGVEDAQKIWEMQVLSFQPLLEKYQDYETSPANETIDRVIGRLQQKSTFFYIICMGRKMVGAVRIIDAQEHPAKKKRISPLFIIPEYQNKGIAQQTLKLCEQIHGSDNWQLETIMQEHGNCHLYEKMGYHKVGNPVEVNDKLTLITYEK